MGFSISWVAFKGLDKADVLRRTGFVGTGQATDIPDDQAPFAYASFPTGWSALFSNDYRFAAPEGLGHLSRGATVLGCQIEEHVMFSAAALFTDGHEVWRVAHESEKGRYDLQTSGTMPQEFEPIRTQFVAQQDKAGAGANVDYIWDIPVSLAHALTGYRHDVWKLAWGEQTYERVEAGR